MSSGKQSSFAFGEVSPSIQYRTDTSIYPQALKTLYNGYVKKGGGAPNRAGTKNIGTAVYQDHLTPDNGRLGVRLFPFYTAEGRYFIIELKDRLSSADTEMGQSVLRAYEVTGETISEYQSVTRAYDFASVNEEYDLSRASYSQLNDTLTISVPCSLPTDTPLDARYKTFIITYIVTGVNNFSYTSVFPRPTRIGTPLTATVTIECYGTAELLLGPVSYTVMQEQDDGSEVFWRRMNFDRCNPNIECQSKLTSIDVPLLAGVKQYNIYRAAGEVYGGHSSLIARVPPQKDPFVFQDFLANPDITVQPPIDEYLYPIEVINPSPLIEATQHIKALFYYKSRAVIIYHPYKVFEGGVLRYRYSPGQFGLSKIGAPKMFGRPLTPNIIDAFSATIPTDKISDITNYLVINRLILFTKDVAVMIRGGDAGILTPQTVNPEIIYNEGCAEDISPVASGTRGFFIPPDKSKLLMIKYSTDDTLSIVDISVFSDHLFEPRDIRTMAMAPGNDSILWILKKNGQLISLSISEEGTVQAFSRHGTDGFIEDIIPQEVLTGNFAKRSGERAYGLIMSVIRNGIRVYETLPVRDDVSPSNFLYADCATLFGSPTNKLNYVLNITAATDYNGGSILTITDLAAIGNLNACFGPGAAIDFNYPSSNQGEGILKFRVRVQGSLSANELQVYAEEGVPEYLQNIQGQSITVNEKLKRQKDYLETIQFLSGLTALAGKEVSVYADGELISSPWNPEYAADILTVDESGELLLPREVNWGYVGLPYYFEMETLDLDASDARTFTDKGKSINSAGVALNKTFSGLIGSRENNQEPTFEALARRETYGNTTPTESITGVRNVPFPASWNMKGSVVIRQVDPLPITVLAVYPKGVIGD